MNINMLALYAKAFVHRPTQNKGINNEVLVPTMPAIERELELIIRPKHCNAYNKLTCWKPSLAAVVHPNYVQTLSLPLQLDMMVNKAFPFSPMGIIHIANQINVADLPEQSGSLFLRTFFGKVYKHPKGWLFEVITLASSTKIKDAQTPQIRATSYYLSRAHHRANIPLEKSHALPQWIASTTVLDAQLKQQEKSQQDLIFSSSIGRQYAKVSGDYNPIHLHKISAKLFGFKKAIAHGMYSKALVLSKIAEQHHFYKGEFEINVLFMQAIGLPAQGTLSTYKSENSSCDFQLSATLSRKERHFLTGTIR